MSKTLQVIGEVALAIVAFALGLPQIGTSLLLLAATTALTATIKIPPPPSVQVPLKQSFAPRQSAFGEVRMAGVYALFEAVPTSDDASTSYDVIACHDGKVNAFTRYYLHDDRVEVSLANNGVISPDGKKYAYGSAIPGTHDRVFFLTRRGLATETAYAEVVAGVPSIWTSAHRGDGVASYALICKQSKDKYQQEDFPNGLPLPGVALESQLIFDPRDGAQTQGTRATYVYSDNPALALLAYMTDAAGGMGFSYARRFASTEAYTIAAADDCDVLMDLDGGGTEKRYRCAGVYKHDTAPAEVIGAILSSFDGHLSQRGDGALIIRSGRYSVPIVTFRDNHVVGLSVQHFLPDEQVVNEVVPSFTDPDSEFNTVDASAWREEADIAARGVTRSQTLDLSWCPSQAQARRLAKRAARRSVQELRGSLVTNLYGLNGLGERYIRLVLTNAEDAALANVVVEITKVAIDLPNLAVTFEWIAADTGVDDWDPGTEEGTIVTPGDRPTFDPLAAPTITAVTPSYDASSADSTGARLSIAASAPVANDVSWLYRWRPTGSTVWTEGAATDVDDGAAVSLVTGFVNATGNIDVEVAYRTAGATSPWSATSVAAIAAPSSAETSITTSEALSAANIVNIWTSAGAKVRKANASAIGTMAHGFVLAGAALAASAKVRTEGEITGLAGLTIGATYYLDTTAGGITLVAPTGAGKIVQSVGVATSATSLDFEPGEPVVLS